MSILETEQRNESPNALHSEEQTVEQKEEVEQFQAERAAEVLARKRQRIELERHRRNIKRCDYLLILEGFVLASVVFALILNFLLS